MILIGVIFLLLANFSNVFGFLVSSSNYEYHIVNQLFGAILGIAFLLFGSAILLHVGELNNFIALCIIPIWCVLYVIKDMFGS